MPFNKTWINDLYHQFGVRIGFPLLLAISHQLRENESTLVSKSASRYF